MRSIYIVLMEHFVLLDAVGALHVFGVANDVLARSGAPQAYRFGLYAVHAGAITSSRDVALCAQALPAAVPSRRGTLIVIGGANAAQDAAQALGNAELQTWLRHHASRFERLACVGPSAVVLAHQSGMGGRLPRGTASQRWKAVGSTEATATALSMVESDMGRAMAMAISGQLAAAFGLDPAHVVRLNRPQAVTDTRVQRLRDWMAERLAQPMTVPRMANQVAMTPRTFARFYRRATGTTPAQDLTRMRLEKACLLIETERSSLKVVAHACGFSSEEVMRRTFLRHLHLSPKAYRQQLMQAAQGL